VIRIGTRGSALALAQARAVSARLPDAVELIVVRTAGDEDGRPIRELGDGAFVARLEEALRRHEIDVAVHSLKDLPTADAPGLVLASVPEREDPRDVLVTTSRRGLDSLPPDARVGTSSPRRALFLQAVRPDIRVAEIRGNVDTRLRKVRDGEYDGAILALAGLRRLGVQIAPEEILDLELMPPAPGQGALAVQCRIDDVALRERLERIEDRAARIAVTAERAVLALLGASCDLALGAHATVTGGTITLDAALAGGTIRRFHGTGADASALARRAAAAIGEAAHAL
jgi:hydroxymethylbilane synthase